MENKQIRQFVAILLLQERQKSRSNYIVITGATYRVQRMLEQFNSTEFSFILRHALITLRIIRRRAAKNLCHRAYPTL